MRLVDSIEKCFVRLRASITLSFLALPLVLASAISFGRENRILAFGDSLTAGYRLPVTESYPAQLEKLLKAKGYKVAITNAGVSGETSAQGLKRVDWVMGQTPFDVVLLCLGANDGLRQLPVREMESNLGMMIDKFRSKGAKVLLIGMRVPTNVSKAYATDFERVFPHVAKIKHVPLLPFLLDGVAGDVALNTDDQIHPNAKGYAIIAGHLLKFVEPYLKH